MQAAALSEEARSETERTVSRKISTLKVIEECGKGGCLLAFIDKSNYSQVAQMREEFEMEKSKWGAGAEQGLMEYGGGQRENQEVGDDFVMLMVSY